MQAQSFHVYSISGEQNIFDVVAAETNLCDTKDDSLDTIMNTIERKWHLTHKRSFPFGGCESNLLLHLLTYTHTLDHILSECECNTFVWRNVEC